MSHVSAVLYKKESRELHLLSRCDRESRLRSLPDELGKMAAAMGIIEVLNAVTHDEERNVPLFDLLVASLRSVDAATKNAENALYFFEAHLLEILGFRPDFSRCARCGGELPEEQTGKVGLNFAQGGVYGHDCSARGFGLESFTPGSVNVLRRMLALGQPEAALRITLSGPMRAEVGTLLRRYLTTNVEGLRRLKSETVFASLLT
jgi:DNA repair protein RecO (recombination protein O)